MLQTVLIAGIIFLVYTVQPGLSIRCYECNSHNDTRCGYDIPPENLSVNCGDHAHGVKYSFCRKITQVIEFSVNGLPPDSRIIRGCGWEDSSYKNACYQRAGFGGRQEVCACSVDNCNAAESIKSSYLILMPTLILLFWLYSKKQ